MVISCTLGYLFYLGSNLLFMTLFPPVMLLFIFNRPLQHRIAGLMFRGFCRFLTRVYLPALNVYRIVEQSGFEKMPPRDRTIFVANHRSRMDGPMLLPLLTNCSVLIKSTYARLPLYSNMVRYLDFISVDPHSIDSLADATRACKESLSAGKSLLIFPEGTRSRGKRLSVFKDLAFRLAIESGTTVTPVIVHTDRPFMGKIKGSLFPARKMSMVIRALDSQRPLPGERPAGFADRIRTMMSETLRELDRGTMWENLCPGTVEVKKKRRDTSAVLKKTNATEPAPTPTRSSVD